MRESGGQSANGPTACEHFRRVGRPLALCNVVTFLSAAAVSGDQSLVIAAFTFDRKDARRKDAHHATRHYLRFSLPCPALPGRTESSEDDSLRGSGKPVGETHVNLIKSHFTPRGTYVCTHVCHIRTYICSAPESIGMND